MQSPLTVRDGYCYLFFAFDIGLSIDLERCEVLIKEATERTHFRRNRKAPSYFDFDPPPLRITQSGARVQYGRYSANPSVDLTLFDFGAVSVCYSLKFTGPFSDLVSLSNELYDSPVLRDDARERVDQLLREVGPAITKPEALGPLEDYTIFQLNEFEQGIDLRRFWDEHDLTVAQILRADTAELSASEIQDALACRISYSSEDQTAIDWNAALIIGGAADDVRAVLEYGNVELLEMRNLDLKLDAALDQAYQALTQGQSLRADLRAIAEIQVDTAMGFEGVNNALKLLGDQYLARVYSLVVKRFHLEEWDNSILRKTKTLDSIYGKISDRANHRRSEFLEWVIILLITFEIVFPFVK